MPSSTSSHTRAGFTLLEVIIALAILGSSMVLLLESHYGSLLLFSEAQDEVLKQVLSKQGSALAELEILTGVESGGDDFGEAYPGYSYTFRSKMIDEFELPGLFEVTFVLHTPTEEAEPFIFRVYDGAVEYEN